MVGRVKVKVSAVTAIDRTAVKTKIAITLNSVSRFTFLPPFEKDPAARGLFLFQFNDRHAGFTFAIHAQTVGPDILMSAQMLMDGIS